MGSHSKSNNDGLRELKITKRRSVGTPTANTPVKEQRKGSSSKTQERSKRLSSGLLLTKSLSPDKGVFTDQVETHTEDGALKLVAVITPTPNRLSFYDTENGSDEKNIKGEKEETATNIDVSSMMRRVSNSLHQHQHTHNFSDSSVSNDHKNPSSMTSPRSKNGRNKRYSHNSVVSAVSGETLRDFNKEQQSCSITDKVTQPENNNITEHQMNEEGNHFKEKKIGTADDGPSENNVETEDEDGHDSDDSFGWEEMEPVASHTIYDDNGKLQIHNQNAVGHVRNLSSNTNNQTSFSKNDKKTHKIANQKEENEGSSRDDFELEEDVQKTHESPSKNTFGYTKIDDEEQAIRSRKTNKVIDFLFTSATRNCDRSQIDLSTPKISSTEAKQPDGDIHGPSDQILSSESTLQENKNTSKDGKGNGVGDDEENENDDDEGEEEVMGGLSHEELTAEHQLSTMKKLLTDKEKFAYVGAVYVLLTQQCADLAELCLSSNLIKKKKLAKQLQEIQKKAGYWQVEIMSRLYHHLDFSESEIDMINKLGLHGLDINDLCKSIKVARSLENPYLTEAATSSGDSIGQKSENELNVQKSEDVNEKHDTSVEKETTDKKDTVLSANTPDKVISVDEIQKVATLDIDVSWTIICDFFLLLLAKSTYDSRSRTLLLNFAKHLNITKDEINHFEKRILDALEMEQSMDDQVWNEQEHMTKRRNKVKKKKLVYVGLATIGGSLVLGVSGGLLAPVIGAGFAAGMSTVGLTGITGFLTSAGGTAAVAATSTAIGANIGNRSMTKRMGSVKTFEFKPLHNNRRVNLIVSVAGWMIGNEDDVRLPFSTVDPIEGDLYSLYWEPEMLKSTGQTINILASEIITQTIQQILGATILTALMAALQLPMALSKLGYIIDNPWNVSLDRAWNAGLLLADTLASKNLGERPITLIGFSLGSRVIYSCLKELCKKGMVGIVENVIIFGSPVVYNRDELVMCRSVVSGRFVNGYSLKDWVLGYLFRATGGGLKTVAGLSPIETLDSIENFDCSEWVQGHMEYRKNIPILLKKLGYSVLSEEFVEIDDSPDPEQLKKQREIIHSLDAAQKKLDSKKGSHKSGWLPKWLAPKKESWQEMMEDNEKDRKTGVNGAPKEGEHDSSIVDTIVLQRELETLKKNVSHAPQLKVPGNIETIKNPEISKIQNTDEEKDGQRSHVQVPNFQLLQAGHVITPEKNEREEEFQESDTKQFQFGDDF